MMRKMTLFLGAIALTLPPAVAGQDFTCPQNITITETAQSVLKDWRVVHDANPVRLFTVAMSYEDGFFIRDDFDKKLSNGRTEYTWDLNSPLYKHPWFVRREYQQTNILLLIPVPETLKFCSTTQKDGPNRDVENIMHCK